MDHKELLASLSDEQRRSLNAKSNGPALVHLAGHTGLLVLLGSLIVIRVPFWPLLMLPHGVLLVFLFTLQHETAHETAFASPMMNKWITRICGFLIFMPPLWFRYFHFAHHRHTQDVDNDPELEDGKPETWRQYVWHVSGLPLWWSLGKTLFANAMGRGQYVYVPQRAEAKIKLEARILLLLHGTLFAGSLIVGSTILLFVWVIPTLLGQPFLRLYLLAEHGRCAFVANMLENTRTTYTNRLVRWLAWNMPFHIEHHTMPTAPFHKLPELNALTREHLKATSNGYSEFHKEYVETLA